MSLRITITNDDQVYTICDTPDPMSFSGWQPTVEGSVQSEPVYGAASRFHKYRGNDLFHETFTIWRRTDDDGLEFADGYEASMWFRHHLITLPREGRIDFIYDAGAQYYLGYGTIIPIKLAKQIGKTLVLSYTIQGSPLALL